MNDDNKKSIKNAVLSEIKSGKATMRPRWHFVLKSTLKIVGTIIIVLALVYLASFIFFVLRQTGIIFTPAFGFYGIGVFLTSLPWLLLILAVIFIVVLEILVKQYSFGYRKPLLYSIIGIVALVSVGSFTVLQAGFHHDLLRYALERKLPLAGPFYRSYGLGRAENVHVGVINKIQSDGFYMSNLRSESLIVITTSKTRFPQGEEFKIEDRVVVLGKRDNGTIQAIGVRKFEDGRYIPRRGLYRRLPPVK